MSPEERTRIYGDTPQARVMNFIDTLGKDGYIMVNFSRIRELSDIIAQGVEEPLKNYQSLKDLESRMINEEELTSKFRFGIRDLLNKISNIVKNDPKFLDQENTLDTILNDIKTKLGIIQAADRVAEAEASRIKTKAEIDALDSDPNMSIEEKNKKARELLFTYNGANLKAIENAKYISRMQENNFSKNFNIDFIDQINQDLKKLYNYIMTVNLLPETKKTLIDNFNNLASFSNEHKAILSKHNSNKKLYENAMKSLGISKETKSKVKAEELPQTKGELTSNLDDVPKQEETINSQYPITEYVHKIGEFVSLKDPTKHQYTGDISGLYNNKNYKITDLKLIDGLTYYKLEGLDDKYYLANNFEEAKEIKKSEEMPIQEENTKGKKVIANKPRIGKGAIAARMIAVTYITGGILIPAVGPIALVPGIIYAYKEYKSYKNQKNETNDLTITQKAFAFLANKIKEKASNVNTIPEEKAELDEMEAIVKEEVEPEVKSELEQDIPDFVAQAQSEMLDEGLSKEEMVDKALESLANTPADESPSMKGR